MPITANMRKAASWPFQIFDCHIRNHSPPTLRKTTSHISKLTVRAGGVVQDDERIENRYGEDERQLGNAKSHGLSSGEYGENVRKYVMRAPMVASS